MWVALREKDVKPHLIDSNYLGSACGQIPRAFQLSLLECPTIPIVLVRVAFDGHTSMSVQIEVSLVDCLLESAIGITSDEMGVATPEHNARARDEE